MLVPSGSNLTWSGDFDGTQFDTIAPVDAISAISAKLKNNYNLVVNDYDFDTGFTTVTLYLVTNMDRGSNSSPDDGAADIKSNVDDAWANLNTSGVQDGTSLQNSSITVPQVNLDYQGAASSSYGDTSSASDFVQNLLPSWLGGTPVTPAQQAARTKAANAQIGSVAANAAVISGPTSAAARAAATMAASQKLATVADQAKLNKDAVAAAAASDSAYLNRWLWVGGAVAVVVVLAVLAPYFTAARS